MEALRAEPFLVAAGWHAGRRVGVERWATLPGFGRFHTAARDFLAEFGGLFVEGAVGVDFDPLSCGGDEDRFTDCGAELGRELFPIGAHTRRYCLVVDERSGLYLLEHWVGYFGDGAAWTS